MHIDENWFSENSNITMKSLVKSGSKYEYVKWPISIKNEDVCTYDNRMPCDPDNIDFNSEVRFIVEVPYMWIKNDNCGLFVVIRKIVIKEVETQPELFYKFDDNSEDECENNSEDEHLLTLLVTEAELPTKATYNTQSIPISEMKTPSKKYGGKNSEMVSDVKTTEKKKKTTETPKKKITGTLKKKITETPQKRITESKNTTELSVSMGTSSSDYD